LPHPVSGHRVRKLYVHPCCDYFLSRQALGLTYTSCREDESYRALRQAQKIALRLDGTGALDELERLPKPKGMRWHTDQRLRITALEASARLWSEAMKRFHWLNDDRLNDLLIAR
jgi:hypothetical protein